MHDPSAVAKLLVWLPRPAVEGAKGFVRTQVAPPPESAALILLFHRTWTSKLLSTKMNATVYHLG